MKASLCKTDCRINCGNHHKENCNLSERTLLEHIYNAQTRVLPQIQQIENTNNQTESLELLSKTYQAKSTSALPVLFTEIKKDELVNIYSAGLDKEKESVVKILGQVNPSLSKDWNAITANN